MLIYKFLNKKYGLLALKTGCLKVSRISDLNDPFELLAPDLSNPAHRSAFKQLKSQMSNVTGLLCFSKYRTNPMLWSHYADKHKGVCLGFEAPEDILQKVVYTSKRPNAAKLLYGKPESQQSGMEKMIATKYIHWKYETEMRIWDDLQKRDPSDDFFIRDFSPNLKLKKVVVGAEANISRSEVENALGGRYLGVEQFKVRAAFKSFKVVRNKDGGLWT